jgi:hypothetical protein
MNGRLQVRGPSPALVVSVAALFFAVGGSAFAVGERLGAAQPRCANGANGAVKGFAYVTGDPSMGIHNLAQEFTRSPTVFGARFNCAGKAVEVRRNRDTFEIRFLGVVGRTATVSSTVANVPTPAVTRLPDGSFRITPQGVGDPAFSLNQNHQFAIVVV